MRRIQGAVFTGAKRAAALENQPDLEIRTRPACRAPVSNGIAGRGKKMRFSTLPTLRLTSTV
jgi:hypothetical protein